MAIAFRDSAHVSVTTAGGAKTITIPSTVVVGDLLILDFCAPSGGAPAAAPAGWTAGPTATDSITATSFYRVAQSGDGGTTVTVSQSTGTRAHLIITAYSGVDTGSPIGLTNTATESGTSATHSGASITTTDTAWIHRALYMKDGGTPSTTITPPSGFTNRESLPGNTFSSTFQAALAVADSNGDVAAGVQSGTWTVDQSTSDAVAMVMELVPLTTTVTVRPASTVSSTGTTIVGGATADAVLADDDPATYVEVPTGGTFTVETIFDAPPAPLKSITVKFYGAGSPATMSVDTKLYVGSTPIVDFGAETAVVTSETTFTYAIDAAGQAAQTNLADLHLIQVCTVT